MQHKLLIVDDEPRIYHALRRALHREQGWETVYAESGEAALELLGASDDIDVIVSDENMPGMNGTQLLGLVRGRHPDVIRMMLTGDARIDVVMNAVNNGEIYRFFTKPCNEAELIIAIRDALQMKKLKSESRRLLELVKKQQARIRMLEGDGSPLPEIASTETTDVPVSEGGALSLDALTRKGGSSNPMPSVSNTPQQPTGMGAPGSEAAKGGVIDLGDTRGDVDSLLNDITSELDDILK
jgi:two-component system probable response regulator PhcQ